MSVVDDFGRYSADLPVLLSRCFPRRPTWADEELVSVGLAECAEAGLICLYIVDGRKFVEITNFDQRLRENQKSKWPSPESAGISRESPQKSAYARATPSTTPPTTNGKGCGENPDPNFTEDHPGYWAERMYARHPKKKNLPLVQMTCAELWNTKTLYDFREIDRIHALWCDTDDWRKSNGKFCPKLDEWLMDRGWTKQPELDEEEDPEAGNRRYAESQIAAKAIQEAEWRKNPL
jgi:hypothetical protein